MHEDMTYRWCKKEDETQLHILYWIRRINQQHQPRNVLQTTEYQPEKTAEILQKVIFWKTLPAHAQKPNLKHNLIKTI